MQNSLWGALSKFALITAVSIGASAGDSSPAQAAAVCNPTPGYLIFADEDASPDRCGQVAGNNPDWARLPGQNWRNKADIFWNRGNTHDACVYSGTSYNGSHHRINRGAALRGRNWGRSNKWVTRAGSC